MADDQTTERRFGANYWVVDEMYRQYLADPDSVAESWHEFFSDYTPASQRVGRGSPPRTAPGGPSAGDSPAPDDSREAPPREEAAPEEASRRDRSGGEDRSGGGRDRLPEGATRMRGVAARIAEHMSESLRVPTATSIRVVPAKLLEVNRTILNNHLSRTRGGRVSFTHLIGYAVVRAMTMVPNMRSSYAESDGQPHVVRPGHLNLGLAVDVERADGRVLLVPNVKQADSLDFAGFLRAYEDVIRRVKDDDLDPEMFADTTATLTNPGTVGTVGSVPRLMRGQSVIVGVGAIGYPAEYQGADPRALAEIGVGKVITVTSTYDHRVIQGAESGLFLRALHELLTGEHGFYDDIFQSLHVPYEPVRWRADEHSRLGTARGDVEGEKLIAVQHLINMYRVRGHLIGNLDPLSLSFKRVHPELDPATYGLTIWDLDREFLTDGLGGRERLPLGEILGLLRDAYCRTVGVEYMHIAEPGQKRWLQERIEGVSTQLDTEDQRHILGRLNAAEAFEKFLHTKYIGHKRFSLEGAESTIPMLDALLEAAADDGIGHAVMGMAHRGRLNVLVNILGKRPEKIFREFEGDVDPDSVQGSGDVKYHLGSSGRHRARSGNEIEVAMSSNPSHLEAVNPVVEGMARALIDEFGDRAQDGRPVDVLPILLHGDAGFAGEGVVQETLTMSQLSGYRTGGTVHLVINNQLGFTTSPEQGRSSIYCTDVAKMVQAPIFHVNGDDPEACVRVMRLAFAFRQRFAKDVVVDLICYRRWGHNEADDPSYTQPRMYRQIEQLRSVRKRYTEELVNRGDITVDEAEQALDDFRRRLEDALAQTKESGPPAMMEDLTEPAAPDVAPPVKTGVNRDTLERVVARLTSWPDDFDVHPKLGKQLQKRGGILGTDAVDWPMGEMLAFGSLLLEGFPVRLAGQDSRRGTFSQRHSVLVDHSTGEEFTPLAHLGDDQAPFRAYDSPLNEFAAMGFEYGYSVARKDALVMWEGQFGDFVNGAQVVVDQFVAAAEDKWGQTSGLVLLLPHGYEGQGPEHSSARIERFLTLSAAGNIQVTQPTTAAQYFHLLRRQMHRNVRKPLVVFTPKSMLRAKAATSPAAAFEDGHFREVLADPRFDGDGDGDARARRVLLCSGKIAHQLVAHRDEQEAPVAVVRVEQLYPFPQEQIREEIGRLGEADEVVWVQDEPENMGPWAFMHGRLHRILRESHRLRHVARPESPAPATGSANVHERQARQLLDDAFAGL
jgi:multifunctional 2-oxoglutarate metabolism enzyme